MERGDQTPTAALIEPSARARPRARHRALLGREAEQLQRELRLFDHLMDMATDETDETKAAELEDLAWTHMEEAAPIRVVHAVQLLDVSENTVRDWAKRGVLRAAGESPIRVGLESVLRVKEIVDELRELGRDRGLLNAVLNRLELEELQQNDRFRESLEQMRRGERGQWPKRWAGQV